MNKILTVFATALLLSVAVLVTAILLGLFNEGRI